MARILGGVNGIFALSGGGGGGLGCFRPCLPSLCPSVPPRAFIPSGPVPCLPWGIFKACKRGFLRASRLGIFKRGQIWPFLAVFGRFEGISRAWRGFGWVGLLSGLCGAFCGCYSFCLRAVSTCKGQKAVFYPCLCLSRLVLWSACPFIVSSWERQ